MTNVIFTLNDFSFPDDLDEARSTFRIRLSLRYINSDGVLTDTDEIMPGAGEKDYFECESSHKKDKNYVRSEDSATIDISKIVSKSSKEVVFAGLKSASLVSLRVSIFDAEKDGFFDRFWRKALQVAFGVSLDIFAGGLAITVGNLLTALKKDSKDRPQVEQQFDDLISSGISAKKMYLLGENDNEGSLNDMKTGDLITVNTSSKQYGDFSVVFKATVL